MPCRPIWKNKEVSQERTTAMCPEAVKRLRWSSEEPMMKDSGDDDCESYEEPMLKFL